MRAVGEDDVLEHARLRGQRLVQPRMRVPVNVDPPGRGAVEQLPAVLRVEIHALAAHDRQRIGPRLHLRVGMPDDGAVAGDKVHGFAGSQGSQVHGFDAGHRVQGTVASDRAHRIDLRRVRLEGVGRERIERAAARRRRTRGRSARSPRDCRRSGSPTITTPATVSDRARSASSVSSVWLIVPRAVRATTNTGKPERSPSDPPSVSCSLTGTSTPPAPSTIQRSIRAAVPRSTADEVGRDRCCSPVEPRRQMRRHRTRQPHAFVPAPRRRVHPPSRRTSRVSSSCSMPV